jgi:serine/threonine protein kinase
MPIPDNRILGEKYRLIRLLDEGAMGSVWLAEHLSLHSPVAIKLIAPEVAETEDGVQRFLREARTAASLRNPHVVQILDYGVQEGIPYIVMELLDGEALSVRLRRVGRLSPRETAHVLRHVSRALARAHDAGIVHRDLKPANIFIVSNEEEEELIKLLDFGIAKARLDVLTSSMASNTRTGVFLGTPFYMSPEQVEGSKGLDYRADIWAMGVLAYECLLGKLPFDGDTFGALVLYICSRPLPVPSQHGAVPEGFDAWFARACARDPAQRFQSAREAAAELRRLTDVAAGEGEGAQPPPPAVAVAVHGDVAAPARPLDPPPLNDEPSLPPASGLSQTNGAASKAALDRQGLRGNRWALLGAVALGLGLLFVALQKQPAGGARAASDPIANAAQKLRPATGLEVSGEGGTLRLFVDGAEVGLLPQALRELQPGEHVIRITGGPSYRDYERRVAVKPGRMTRLGPIKLPVTRGLATIRAGNAAAEGAEVVLEVGASRRTLAALPLRVEVDTSKPCRLLARRPGYAPFEQRLTFADGQAEQSFEISLVPASAESTAQTGSNALSAVRPGAVATLNVDSRPSSRVLLDGKLLGVTPLTGIAVEPGQHQVVFINGVERRVETLTLSPGKVSDVKVEF